jgi:hypothetical protein
MNDDATNWCEHLDNYLDGDLPPEASQQFAAHLNHCPTCREAIDEQRWIDALLRSDEAPALEAAPALRIWFRGKRMHRRVLVAAAAATIAAIAAWQAVDAPLPRREGPGEGLAEQVAQPPDTDTTVPERLAQVAPQSDMAAMDAGPSPSPSLQGRRIPEPTATFVSTNSAIAVPIASDDPQVTIVKLYPTTAAARRMALEIAVHAVAAPRGG